MKTTKKFKEEIIQWKNQTKFSPMELRELAIGAAWESGAVLLLMFVSISMLSQLSPKIRIDLIGVITLFMLVTITVFFYEVLIRGILSREEKPGKYWLIRIGSKVLPAILCFVLILRYQATHVKELNDGFVALSQYYLKAYDLLFDKSHQMVYVQERWVTLLLSFLAILSFFVTYFLSFIGKRKWLILAMPLMTLSLIMYVGLSPHWGQIIALVLGIFIIIKSHRRGKKEYAFSMGVIGLMLFLLFLFGCIFSKSADRLLEKSAEVKTYEAHLEDGIKEIFVSLGFSQSQVIDNSKPVYKGKKILTLRMDQEPAGNLYLKEALGENYENGEWTFSSKSFTNACSENGIDEAVAATYLESSVYWHLCSDGDYYKETDFEIKYYSPMKADAFLPYGVNVKDRTDLQLLHDAIARKTGYKKNLSFHGLNSNGFGLPANRNYSMDKLLQIYTEEELEGEKAFWSWYNDYVKERYMNAPDYIKELPIYDYLEGVVLNERRYGTNQVIIESEDYVSIQPEDHVYISYEYLEELVGSDYMEKTYPSYQEGEQVEISLSLLSLLMELFAQEGWRVEMPVGTQDGELDNSRRYEIVCAVQQIMTGSNSIYSWDLDMLEDGEDPIEHFLRNHRKGYCKHYASAGVLLLRELGVPARYVTGYIVKPASFVQQEDGSYEAEVIDRNGHAWVEVFYDNIGWVPVEMTPGYGPVDEDIPTYYDWTKESSTPFELETEPKEVMSSVAEIEETAEPEQMESSEETPESEQMESSEETPVEEEETEDSKTGIPGIPGIGFGDELVDDERDIQRIVNIVLGVVIISAIILLVRMLVSNSKVEKVIAKKCYKKATLMINKKVYRRAMAKDIFNKRAKTDKEFETALMKQLGEKQAPNIEEYMRIVKAAAFSEEEISQSECMFTWNLYQRLRHERAKT